MTEFSTYLPVDCFSEEALEHFIGIGGFASVCLRSELLYIFGLSQTVLIEDRSVGIDCSDVVFLRYLFKRWLKIAEYDVKQISCPLTVFVGSATRSFISNRTGTLK